MQFGTLSPNDNASDAPTGSDRTNAAALPAAGFDPDSDPTLALLQGCVEAMSLLQAKFVGLDVETQIKLDAAGREIVATRAALAESRLEMERSVQRLKDCENRIARLEVGAVDAARQHANDIAAARAEAATARLRGETDAMAFDHLLGRLMKIEDSVLAKLERAERDVTTRDAENAMLRTQAEAADYHAAQLEAKLRDVEATIADQRSRISRLQAKLAMATYAVRMDHVTHNAEMPQIAQERDILDLKSLDKDLISAA